MPLARSCDAARNPSPSLIPDRHLRAIISCRVAKRRARAMPTTIFAQKPGGHASVLRRTSRFARPMRYDLLQTTKPKQGNAMPLLSNHIAVVTGAASGIGRAIAVGFAREGARVVLLDINDRAAAEAAKEIRDMKASAESFKLDVTRREECFAVAKEIAAKVGGVSILCNNAGINRRNAFTADAEAVLRDWQDIMAINLDGMFNVTHALLEPLMA